MPRFKEPISIAPNECEVPNESSIDAAGYKLDSYETKHLEPLSGTDGEYVMERHIS